ncbi:Macrolide export ATP-binding/permease protein MacB [Desulfovibrio sp. DV]|uniref:ABC transporter permease n=1 Tax=Desulfovibrio sp. DV TaxID=1844708 RepID=UPI00095B77BF|nr:Macrolide export ATP-binding/permease protein MacB [Desulfovibrio sp. DV]
MAWLALLAHKARSLFVVAAVAMGIAALTVIVASVDGARRKALEIVDFFGPDAVLVLGGDIENRPVGQRVNTLTWSDARAIARSLPGAYAVLPMRSVRAVTLKYGNRNYETATVVGATEDYAQTWNWPLAEGRDLSADDIKYGAKVALIGDVPARELFGEASPVGRTVLVKNLPVQIIGRLAYRGFTGGGSDTTVDDRLIMPISTLTQRFNLNRSYFRGLRVRFHNPELIDAHKDNLRALLRHEHKLEPTQPDDFTLLSASEILKFLTAFTGGLVAFLGVTAGVAILVGGFVLANLMFLGVSERRVEIGLRKAVGATSTAIMVQFLSEAVYLTLVGAVFGIGLGVALGESLSRLGMLELRLSPKIFVLSLAAALAIALVFGLRPARKAAALDPIEALRGGGE